MSEKKIVMIELAQHDLELVVGGRSESNGAVRGWMAGSFSFASTATTGANGGGGGTPRDH